MASSSGEGNASHSKSLSSFVEQSFVEKVPILESDEENEEGTDTDEGTIPKKKRSQSKDWIFVKKFEDKHSAEEYIKAEKIWSFLRTHDVEEGRKKYFRCNKVVRKGPQCSAQLYLTRMKYCCFGQILIMTTIQKRSLVMGLVTE